jgi:hypothetical protein
MMTLDDLHARIGTVVWWLDREPPYKVRHGRVLEAELADGYNGEAVPYVWVRLARKPIRIDPTALYPNLLDALEARMARLAATYGALKARTDEAHRLMTQAVDATTRERRKVERRGR